MANGRERILEHRKVLVVEDEYFLADDIAQSLRECGAEVLGPVATKEAALSELSRAKAVDAAVLDVNLQGEAVYPVADACRARNIPFVFGTGYEPGALRPEYRDVPRWQKPFDPVALVRALPELMSATVDAA